MKIDILPAGAPSGDCLATFLCRVELGEDGFIAACPALGISEDGATEKEAVENMRAAVAIRLSLLTGVDVSQDLRGGLDSRLRICQSYN